MHALTWRPVVATLFLLILFALPSPLEAAGLALGPEELVQAGGADLVVLGYSVPSFVFWDGDTLKDLLLGEGSGSYPSSKVRVYVNSGSPGEPQFGAYDYVQSEGSDLVCPGSG
jgi:hypothetical protein